MKGLLIGAGKGVSALLTILHEDKEKVAKMLWKLEENSIFNI